MKIVKQKIHFNGIRYISMSRFKIASPFHTKMCVVFSFYFHQVRFKACQNSYRMFMEVIYS